MSETPHRSFSRLARRLSVVVFAVTATTTLFPETASGIPAFARRYDVPCHFCHDGFPKLSVIGEQFKERGFRLPREEASPAAWLDSVPAILRAGIAQTFVENAEDPAATGFFKLVSAGNVGPRVSYWADQTWIATDNAQGELDVSRVGTDNAWLRVELVPEELYVRAGRIELDLPFSQARTPHLFGYDVYFANTGFESDNIGQHQDGVEAGGFLDEATRWSVAVVRGRNAARAEALTPDADDFDANVYSRLVRWFGEHRVGVFAYVGRNTLARDHPVDPQAPPLVWEDDLVRIGADGSVYAGRLHLYGVVLHGRNDNSFADADHPDGTRETLSFTGGFVQLDYAARDDVYLSGRLNLVHGPPPGTAGPSVTEASVFPGVKVWMASRFRVAFEIGFQNRGRPTLASLQGELAF